MLLVHSMGFEPIFFKRRFLLCVPHKLFNFKIIPITVGAQGGNRTRKTTVLSRIPMPIRLLGHIISGPAQWRPTVFTTG